MDRVQAIELLAPARTGESGVIAVNSGADAVYIGAPKFGARAAAANSTGEIEKLVRYAHRFHARVYAALNTILYDDELEEARRIIIQLVDAGIDALIIQDMGILEMDLPPIALHASTQVNNYTPEHILFLERAGFTRVVLARELTLQQIGTIRQQTSLELEAFVHGALCVSMSGQCYMSLAGGERSGNRGECAQPCRKSYDLLDGRGQVIIRDKHLLSLRDLDLSDHLHDLAFAGISSFKIEGRLKDDLYLRNITVHYRRKLDAFLSGNPGFTKSSSGKVYPDFQPDPAKTFSRGRSNYFLMGRQHDITSFDTPKSAGEKIAMVIWSEGNTSRVNVEKPPGNNDGITWIDREGVLQGAKVNTVEGNMIRWAGPVDLRQGTVLYRNYDHAFSTMLRNSRTLRRIPLEITVFTSPEGLLLIGTDEAGISFSMNFPAEKVVAHDAGKAGITLREQLFKSGDSIFEVTEVKIQWDEPVFLPVSSVNAIRRDFLAAFTVYREGCMPRLATGIRDREARCPASSVTWLGNVSNRLARQFYEKHGVSKVEPALEITRDFRGRRLMTMKHCLKYHHGFCPREKPASPVPWQEPLFLRDGRKKYRLEFDCKGCFMNLIHE